MKNVGRILAVAAMLAFVAVFAVACGSSSSSSSDTGEDAPTISDISQLPKATSPMASSSASISKDESKAATTGLNLLSATTASFSQTDSMAACNAANVLKDSITSASQADMILCFVQNMNAQFGSLTDPITGGAIDIYDGSWHIFNMNIVGGAGQTPDKVKMRIVKDAAGSITSFTMFMCQTSGNTSVQNEYTSQTISGASFTMAAKGNFADVMWTGSHEVSVTGTLNASRVFTQKAITVRNTGGGTGDVTNTNWQESTLTQTPGSFLVSGYQSGTYSDQTNTGTYQEATYGTGEILGDTSATITNLAMGDGAVNVDARYTYSNAQGSGEYDPAATVYAWLGDTLAAVDPASGSSFYTAASAGTIPTPASSVSISFTADQTWDCSDDVVAAVDLPQVNESDMQAACSQYSQDHNLINCYEAIGQYQQP